MTMPPEDGLEAELLERALQARSEAAAALARAAAACQRAETVRTSVETKRSERWDRRYERLLTRRLASLEWLEIRDD